MRMPRSRSTRLALACCITAACAATWAGIVVGQSTTTTPDLQKRLDLLVKALTITRDRHVLKPEVVSLMDGAIRGMLEKIDPDAHYFTATELARFRANTARAEEQAGIGLAIRKDAGQRRGAPSGFRVVAATTGSAAAEAGIRSGDLVTHVDDEAVAGWPSADVEARFVGASGTKVALRLVRQGSEHPFEVALIRRSATTALTANSTNRQHRTTHYPRDRSFDRERRPHRTLCTKCRRTRPVRRRPRPQELPWRLPRVCSTPRRRIPGLRHHRLGKQPSQSRADPSRCRPPRQPRPRQADYGPRQRR